MTFDPAKFEELKWRNIGPPRGGRVVAVAGHPVDPMAFYFGACAGGVWKTTDGGAYWENVSDGFFTSASVGAIAVSQSDPNVIYVGTGESCVRNDVSPGDGVYRSTDGGATWHHLGLKKTRHISRVRIDPSDSNRVYVGALGDIFGPSKERGVYRSTDGGATWNQILFRSENAGTADLWLDPSNPRILYAAVWQARRTPWSMESGGPDSSLYRSLDGGDTWDDITERDGLPKVVKGRMGIAASPARPGRVWALIEADKDKGGLYRSEDYGETWERISEERGIQGRPWYYSHIVPDPQDPEKIYSLNFQFWRSTDGGGTFQEIPTPHGDNHDLWIDPNNPLRMIEGNDGGACVSFNGGESFSSIYNQPTAQFYHVAVDARFPYRVYGTQQDNSAISVPSRTRTSAIPFSEAYSVGHSESGHIAVDPKDSDVVFSGAVGSSPGGGGPLLRYDHKTQQIRNVAVWPEYTWGENPGDLEHRFNWTYPIVFSPHDPSLLYVTGEAVFRSKDHGSSWEQISPDLTRNDKSKLKASGGPITKDTSGAEHYCTIFAFAESPVKEGLFWAGTDDGLVHVSRNGGRKWEEVTPKKLGDWALVTNVEPSPFSAGTAYVSATRYKMQDRKPYLFRTRDHGKNWELITTGMPADDFTRVIRADPARKGLLYSGTESGVYVSFDDGGSWTPLSLNLPAVPVYDLVIKEDDLVVATHGRSFWILDDISVLREFDNRIARKKLHLFTPPVTERFWRYFGQFPVTPSRKKHYGLYASGAAFYAKKKPDGRVKQVYLDAGENPPDGVPISYILKEEAKPEEISLTILDAKGNEIITFSPEEKRDEEDKKPDPPGTDAKGEKADLEDEEEDTEFREGEGEEAPEIESFEPPAELPKKRDWEILPNRPGFNRFYWNMRYPGARSAPDDKGHVTVGLGPIAPPGEYQARLKWGKQEETARFEIIKDPRVNTTKRDFEGQFRHLTAVLQKVSDVNDAIGRLKKIQKQVEPWTKRPGADEDLSKLAKEIVAGLKKIEARLTQPRHKHDVDRLKLPAGLDTKLADVAFPVASSDSAPSRQAVQVFEKLAGLADAALADFEKLIDNELAELNRMIKDSQVAAIDVSPLESPAASR
ncbi:MAG: glycosyl hydrolase [Actinobacteria bacterium]|nr:glycosyl hydrolase [Actinomycetota bacterium]